MKFSPSFITTQLMNHFRQKIVLPNGYTCAHPTRISIQLLLRCNCTCEMCYSYKQQQPDLSYERVITVLSRLRAWMKGPFFVNFSGGEVLLHKDISRIIRFCTDNDIYPKIITNGFLLTPEVCDSLIAAGLEYLSVSIDSLDPAIHDALRGTPGILDRALSGIRYLRARNVEVGVTTTVSQYNSAELPSLTRTLFDEYHISRILFQPITPIYFSDMSPEAFTEHPLWVTDLATLRTSLDTLIDLRSHYPIFNSPSALNGMHHYFSNPLSIEARPHKTCLVGTTNYNISVHGVVRFCSPKDSFGTIDDDPAVIWNGARARAVRLQTRACDYNCSAGCYQTLSLWQKFQHYCFLKK